MFQQDMVKYQVNDMVRRGQQERVGRPLAAKRAEARRRNARSIVALAAALVPGLKH